MKNNKIETNLKGHTKDKKILLPPFLSHDMNMTTSSWFDSRLPEMLWAVLIIANLERSTALNFFRYIAEFISRHNDCLDVTITWISKLDSIRRKEFLEYMLNYSDSIKEILKWLLLFPELPIYEDLKNLLPEPKLNEDWAMLWESVWKAFWHQSQEATDCRWIKVLCMIVWWKIRFSKETEHLVKWILEYPNYWDMRSVRPQIRAMEMWSNEKSDWAEKFWITSFDSTHCLPEEIAWWGLQNYKKKILQGINFSRDFYLEELNRINQILVDAFIKNGQAITVDARLDGIFWIVFFAISLFEEVILYKSSTSIGSRLSLRALVEARITFEYLLVKESSEEKIWEDYRGYGTGQMKLIHLKLDEIENKPFSINPEEIELIVNEDKWLEFTPINLWHWDSTNLRKMSEDVWLKDLYDKYYDYTSSFMHSNWWAVRTSVYQKCMNPLHRYHRIPSFTLPIMPDTTLDSTSIINDMLRSLARVYPECNTQINTYIPKINEDK